MTHDEQLIDMAAQKRSSDCLDVLPHDFGPFTADYRVRCKRCGFEQYSAAPQPLIGCISNTALDFRTSFVDLEIRFLLKRLAESSARVERLGQDAQSRANTAKTTDPIWESRNQDYE